MRKLFVTGGSGLVGGSVCSLALDDWEVSAAYLSNPPSLEGIDWHRVDICETESVEDVLASVEPDLIVHTAAMADIDACEARPQLAWQINVVGTRNVAKATESLGARLIHISTSNVFDGEKGNYVESDPKQAINEYSRTKIAAEDEALCCRDNLIVRTSIVLGFPKTAGRAFLPRAVKTLRKSENLPLPTKEIKSPIDVWTLSSCILELGSSNHSGIFHVAGTEFLPRFEMGLKIAEKIGCDPSLIVPVEEPPTGRAPRPRDASLNTDKARSVLRTTLPDCRGSIDRAFSWAGIS